MRLRLLSRYLLDWSETVLVALVLGAGCAQEPGELVLAQVDGEPITASEFRDFDARIPAGMKEGGQRQVLESLIDKKLLLREADAANMAEDSWFKGELARFKRARLMALYMEREVVAKIEITPEELDRHYRESGRHRALRLGGIYGRELGGSMRNYRSARCEGRFSRTG